MTKTTTAQEAEVRANQLTITINTLCDLIEGTTGTDRVNKTKATNFLKTAREDAEKLMGQDGVNPILIIQNISDKLINSLVPFLGQNTALQIGRRFLQAMQASQGLEFARD